MIGKEDFVFIVKAYIEDAELKTQLDSLSSRYRVEFGDLEFVTNDKLVAVDKLLFFALDGVDWKMEAFFEYISGNLNSEITDTEGKVINIDASSPPEQLYMLLSASFDEIEHEYPDY